MSESLGKALVAAEYRRRGQHAEATVVEGGRLTLAESLFWLYRHRGAVDFDAAISHPGRRMHVTAAPDGPRMIGKLGLDPNELDRDPDGANMLSHLLVAKVAELIRFRMEHPRSSADVDASCEEEAAAA